MCAIVGWAGRCRRGQWRQVHRLLSELLVASARRGTDSTGFAALDRRAALVAGKEPVPSPEFVSASRAWQRLSYPACVVAHCRAATHGSPHTGDNRNNHPFVGHGLAVVVNGIAANYASVASANGLRLDSECDSEVVLRLVEVAVDVPTGLRDCLARLTGGMAVAVLDAERRSVWVARNEHRPTWALRIRGVDGWFICSTREIAEQAVRRAFGRGAPQEVVESLIPLAPQTAVELSRTGRLVAAPQLRESPDLVRRRLFAS